MKSFTENTTKPDLNPRFCHWNHVMIAVSRTKQHRHSKNKKTCFKKVKIYNKSTAIGLNKRDTENKTPLETSLELLPLLCNLWQVAYTQRSWANLTSLFDTHPLLFFRSLTLSVAYSRKYRQLHESQLKIMYKTSEIGKV